MKQTAQEKGSIVFSNLATPSYFCCLHTWKHGKLWKILEMPYLLFNSEVKFAGFLH